MAAPRYVALANPDGLRWQAYRPELERYWRERGVEPDIEVVPWREVIPGDGDLTGLAAFDRPAVVRMESPGRDWDVARLLLAAGAREAPASPSVDWLSLPHQKGRQVSPGLFYAGFARVLRGLKRSFADRPHLRPTACPLAIAEMFDKNASAARLARAGVPVPPSLHPPATPAELLDAIRARRWPTAYVKLNTGSSASAIAVVRALDSPPRATSSLVRLDGDFYSTRRLHHCHGEELDDLLAFLLREGACVQQGLRMAQLEGVNFDVRVVVIHGEPAFTIFRLSPNPMTNLHLGGRRGDPDRCRAAIPPRAWLDGLDHAVEAARLFDSAIVGVDLLFEAGYLRHFVLEVNAFGDFFPNLADDQGRTVHRVEIEATARQFS